MLRGRHHFARARRFACARTRARGLVLVLCFAVGCFDTQDASLGDVERKTVATADAGRDAGSVAHPDAGVEDDPNGEADDDGGEKEDAATSLLCLLEPWHCT